MLKILIVDDEVLIRRGLRTIIDWEKHGFEVVGEAEDGEKALALSKEEEPDIIITDLIMPRRDGMWLIRSVEDCLPMAKVIVLSCHNDYELVREALQEKNTVDYLFKLTMQPQDIINALEKLKGIIEKEKRDKLEVVNYQKLAQRNRMLEYGHYLHGLLRTHGHNTDVHCSGKYQFARLFPPYAVISVLSVDGRAFQANEDMIVAEAATIALRETNCTMELASFASDEFCIIVFSPGESDLNQYYTNFINGIRDSGSFFTGLCVTNINSKISSFKDAYISAHVQAESLAVSRNREYDEVEKAMSYLHDHYSESIKLSSLAEYVHLNESYLSSLIKKKTGSYFTDILNQIRIDEAKKLLLSTNRSVEEISDSVGFSSWSYFSRVFKKVCGVSPAEYRKKCKNTNRIKDN